MSECTCARRAGATELVRAATGCISIAPLRCGRRVKLSTTEQRLLVSAAWNQPLLIVIVSTGVDSQRALRAAPDGSIGGLLPSSCVSGLNGTCGAERRLLYCVVFSISVDCWGFMTIGKSRHPRLAFLIIGCIAVQTCTKSCTQAAPPRHPNHILST